MSSFPFSSRFVSFYIINVDVVCILPIVHFGQDPFFSNDVASGVRNMP